MSDVKYLKVGGVICWKPGHVSSPGWCVPSSDLSPAGDCGHPPRCRRSSGFSTTPEKSEPYEILAYTFKNNSFYSQSNFTNRKG